MPIGHMAILYGFVTTAKFFCTFPIYSLEKVETDENRVMVTAPVLPSITAYLVGVSFYGNSFPECMAYVCLASSLSSPLTRRWLFTDLVDGTTSLRLTNSGTVRRLVYHRRRIRN